MIERNRMFNVKKRNYYKNTYDDLLLKGISNKMDSKSVAATT